MRTRGFVSFEQRRNEIRARVVALQGSKKAGEQWLRTPAIGLNGEVPSKLLRSRKGADLVEELVARLEYGLHS
jgi:uncharacterized protein (DUF2384 family)